MDDVRKLVKVKPLEWVEQYADQWGYITSQHWSEGLGGMYRISIWTTDGDGCLLQLGTMAQDASSRHSDLDAAKAAAQADYEARIYAALTPATDGRADGLREAAEMIAAASDRHAEAARDIALEGKDGDRIARSLASYTARMLRVEHDAILARIKEAQNE